VRRRRAGGRNGAEKWRETEVGVGREAGKVQGDTSAPTGVASRAAAEALRARGREVVTGCLQVGPVRRFCGLPWARGQDISGFFYFSY
jgi:hypothetical protein